MTTKKIEILFFGKTLLFSENIKKVQKRWVLKTKLMGIEN